MIMRQVDTLGITFPSSSLFLYWTMISKLSSWSCCRLIPDVKLDRLGETGSRMRVQILIKTRHFKEISRLKRLWLRHYLGHLGL
jgi:hypothetical protein